MTHKKAYTDLTATFVRGILKYDPKTGIFRWQKTLSKRAVAGKIAGYISGSKKRIKIGIAGKEYMAHRLAWIYMTGHWPKYEIDHKNENQSDNRWNNLRDVTPSQNHRNRGKQVNNSTGYKGVAFDKRRKKFIAGVKLNGIRHNLGSFDTAEQAYKAYKQGAKKFHGPFAKF